MEALEPSTRHKKSISLDRIALVSQANLQANLTAGIIGGHLQCECAIFRIDQIPQQLDELLQFPLILIDCSSVSIDTAAHILNQMQSSPSFAALINTEAGSEHEKLAQWPKLNGIFPTNCDHELLIRGLQRLANRDHWLPRRVMENLLQHYRKAPKLSQTEVSLTRREQQILEQLAEGASNQDIASALYLSEHTVKSHLYNIFKKLRVSNRLQACNWAKQHL